MVVFSQRGSHWLIAVFASVALFAAACGGESNVDDSQAAEGDNDAQEEEQEEEGAEQEALYEGENIQLIVGSSPGGGFDTYAQLMALHWGDEIPGAPRVDVVHQAGAGGMVAFNNTWLREPSDGSVVTFSIGGALPLAILGVEEAEYDPTGFQFIGAPTREHVACMVRGDLDVSSPDELATRDEPLRFGGIAPGVSSDITPLVIDEVTDFNVELISGYGGTSEMHVALLQGEVDANCLGLESILARHADELADGTVRLFMQSGEEPDPRAPEVPLIRDYITDESGVPLFAATVELAGMLTRPLVVHPDVPEERVAALRDSFDAMMGDEDFLAGAEEANLDIDPLTGARLQEIIVELDAALGEVEEDARALYLGEEG